MTSILLTEAARTVMDQLDRAGFSVFLVGGYLRDSLLGRPPGDVDLATDAKPRDVIALFGSKTVVETGLKHGTVTVLMSGKPIEVTTFRADGPYADHRRPSNVTFLSDIETDLSRRDFTVNAMAWNDHRGLIDPFGGQEDLQRRRLRCVGDPAARFHEDSLRVLRALRLAAQLDFDIDGPTDEALKESAPFLSSMASERIWNEWSKLLLTRAPGAVVASHMDVVSTFIPELRLPQEGGSRAVDRDRPYRKDLTARIDGTPPDLTTRLAALFCLLDSTDPCHDGETFSSKTRAGTRAAVADAVLRRLKSDRATREAVVALLAHFHAPMEPTDSWARRLLHHLGAELAVKWLALVRAGNTLDLTSEAKIDEAARVLKKVVAEGGPFSVADLAVDGRDLLARGYPEGPLIGRTLDRLLEAVMDGRAPNERDALLALIEPLSTGGPCAPNRTPL